MHLITFKVLFSFYFASPFATTIIVFAVCNSLFSFLRTAILFLWVNLWKQQNSVSVCDFSTLLWELFCRCLWVFLCNIHFIADCKSVYETTNHCLVCKILFSLLWEQHPFAIMLNSFNFFKFLRERQPFCCCVRFVLLKYVLCRSALFGHTHILKKIYTLHVYIAWLYYHFTVNNLLFACLIK